MKYSKRSLYVRQGDPDDSGFLLSVPLCAYVIVQLLFDSCKPDFKLNRVAQILTAQSNKHCGSTGFRVFWTNH